MYMMHMAYDRFNVVAIHKIISFDKILPSIVCKTWIYTYRQAFGCPRGADSRYQTINNWPYNYNERLQFMIMISNY